MTDTTKPKQRRLRTISASQLDTFADCNRKWWFQRIKRLKEPLRLEDPRTFGDVLHACIERYLRADDTGRDPQTGEVVELFPPGWEEVEDRFGKDQGATRRRVTPRQAEMIQRLVKEGIRAGVIERREGRRVEARFDLTVLKDEPCDLCAGEGLCTPGMGCEGHGTLPTVKLMGFRDVVYPDEVQDHKSAKNSTYFLGPKRLKKNPQGLIYAKAHFEEFLARGAPAPSHVTFRHNQFSKDPKEMLVRTRKATITREEAETYWTSTVIPAARDILRVSRAEEWHQVSGPKSPDTCNKYGGCPYLSICTGRENYEDYEKRRMGVDARVAAALQSSTDPQEQLAALNQVRNLGALNAPQASIAELNRLPAGLTGGMTMAFDASKFASKLAAKKAVQAAVANGGTVATAVAPAPAPKPAPVPSKTVEVFTTPASAPAASAAGGDLPPWATPGCTACGGSGFNSAGNPCRICNVKAKKEGRQTSERFTVEAVDGSIVWVGPNGEEGVTSLTGAVPVTTSVQQTPPAPAAPEQRAEDAVAQVQAVEAAAAPAAPIQVQAPIQPTAPEVPLADPEAAAAGKAQVAQEIAADPKVKRGPGRPKKGFTLLIDCVVSKGSGEVGKGSGVIQLNEVIRDLYAQLCEEQNVEHYTLLDVWQRRDWLVRQFGDKTIAKFGTDFVSVDTRDLEERHVLAVLRAAAGRVIQGVSS